MTALALSDLLVRGRPYEHPVAVSGAHTIPFARFRADVASLASRLRADGCRSAGLWCEDGYAFVIGLLGIAYAGATAVIPPSTQSVMLSGLSGCWDHLVSDDSMLAGRVEPVTAAPDPGPLAAIDVDGCALDFFTSGTTAEPKRVRRTLGQIEREVLAIEALVGSSGLGTARATVSHQHVYGLAFKLLWPLTAGRPFATRSHEVWETLLPELREGDVLVSSPAHLGRLGGIDGIWRPALVLSAGAPLPDSAAKETSRLFGISPTEIYGSTETGAVAHRRASAENVPWVPLPGVEVTQRENSCLQLRSPWVDGVHDSEDVISFRDGGFELHGRADRVVKVEGKRVSLPAVEAALARLSEVREAAVVMLTGERDQLAVAVELSPEGSVLRDRLGDFRLSRLLRSRLAAELEPLGRPRCWRFVDAIPTAAMGKRPDAIVATLFNEKHDG